MVQGHTHSSAAVLLDCWARERTAVAAQRGTKSLLLKWSKLPGVKGRLVWGERKKSRERKREKDWRVGEGGEKNKRWSEKVEKRNESWRSVRDMYRTFRYSLTAGFILQACTNTWTAEFPSEHALDWWWWVLISNLCLKVICKPFL